MLSVVWVASAILCFRQNKCCDREKVKLGTFFYFFVFIYYIVIESRQRRRRKRERGSGS